MVQRYNILTCTITVTNNMNIRIVMNTVTTMIIATNTIITMTIINTVITKSLMPLIDLKPTALFPPHGYIVATTRVLLENTYGVTCKANT